jgi:hypothetical protein
MMMKLIAFGLTIVFIIGTLTPLSTMTRQGYSLPPGHNCPPVCYDLESPQNQSKHIDVQFPDLNEIYQYLNSSGEKKEFKSINNESAVEKPFNYKISVVEKYQNIVWLAFLDNKSSHTDVFVQRSNDSGDNFPTLAKLNNSTAGIPSKLQLDTSDDGKLVYLAWENYNPVDNKTSIWVSSSLNAGNTFRTYSLNVPSDGNGYDPVLKVVDDDILIVWTQDPPMHCFGPHAHNNTGTVTCSHGARW